MIASIEDFYDSRVSYLEWEDRFRDMRKLFRSRSVLIFPHDVTTPRNFYAQGLVRADESPRPKPKSS